MEYFKMISDKDFSNAPRIKNWYGKVDTLKLKYGYAHTMPKRTLLYVEANNDLVFTDIVLKPFFIMTEESKKVVSMYKKTIPFNQVVLLEPKRKQMELYYLPFLSQKKLINIEQNNGNNVYCIDEAEYKLFREPIFKFEDREGSCIVVRLDILESLLRRKTTGFTIEPIEIKGI